MPQIIGTVAWVCDASTGQILGYRRVINNVEREYPLPLPDTGTALTNVRVVKQPFWIVDDVTGAIVGYRRQHDGRDNDYPVSPKGGAQTARYVLDVQWLARVDTGEIVGYRTVNADGSTVDRAVTLAGTLDLNFATTQTLDSRITFTRASTATRINPSGALETVSADVPRFGYDPVTLAPRGLLIEEQRTNSIRNNMMQGAVAGTPGTLPTNWVQSSLGTLTQQVVGTGTENGVTYLDIRYSGTTSNTLITLQFDANTQIAAANGQSWTSSFWVKEAGGSQTNITSISNRMREIDVGGTAIATGTQTITVNTTLSRNTFTRTLTNASTAFIANQIAIAFASGAAIDITLRIGLPQLEQGAFATSVIPTTNAAATRSADVAVMTGTNFSSWYNAGEGTLFAEASLAAFGTTPAVFSASDGTDTGNLIQVNTSSTGLLRYRVTIGGVAQVDNVSSGVTAVAGAAFKTAAAYRASDFAISANAAAAVTQSSGSVPAPTQLRLMQSGSGGAVAVGYLRRVVYYPFRLSNAELQAITA